MTGIEIFTLVILVVFLAVGVAYQFSKHHGSLKDMVQDVKDIEVQAEQVAKELYNKDLRPVVAKKAAKKEAVTSQDITPQVVDKAVEIAKVVPEAAAVNVEPVVEKVKESKLEFPIDKPKKKRKYYPRKK